MQPRAHNQMNSIYPLPILNSQLDKLIFNPHLSINSLGPSYPSSNNKIATMAKAHRVNFGSGGAVVTYSCFDFTSGGSNGTCGGSLLVLKQGKH